MIRPKLRFATNADARDIEDILEANGQIPGGHDWSDIGHSWIVAEYKDTIVGCVQVLLGKPLGHIGFLAVMPGYQNEGIGVFLGRAAWRVLANNGCDGYTCTSNNERLLKKCSKVGGVVFGDPVSLMFKRVYRQGVKY